MSGRLSARLSTGTITVEVDRALVPPEDLFAFGERCNNKRSFLFVSKVLGRHIPAAPSAMRRTYEALAAQIPADLPGPVLVTGMAETAIGLGAGVHQEYAARRGRGDAVFLSTTRHDLGTPILTEFLEEHSHAAHHMVLRPTDPAIEAMVLKCRTLVLVDDEASTGRTFVNLHNGLVKAGLRHIEQVYLVTLTDWSDGRAADAIGPGALSVSLMSGRYHWHPLDGAVAPAMRQGTPHRRPGGAPDPRLDWGRLGIVEHAPARLGGIGPAPRPGERILVVGTSEHVWQPFLLAERLERAGADVRYSSVTRSPIADGHAIRHSLVFTDNYGFGIQNYLYNVDRRAYDRVLLCTETAVETIDPVLLAALAPEVVIDRVGQPQALAS